MNGLTLNPERPVDPTGIFDRHTAVDVSNDSSRSHEHNHHWQEPSAKDRLSACPSVDRSTLLRSHAAKSAECPQGPAQTSPRPRRAPRESRRVSLAQASGYVQLNQYRLLEPIGQGSYGIVKLAYNEEDDTHYAMKILSKRKLMRRAGLFGRTPPRRPSMPGPVPDPLQRVYREIAVLKKLDHPNVVKLVEVLDDPAEDQLYLVFQLLEGGPVIDIPSDTPLSEELSRRYLRDTLLGVEYLHYQGIAHRDLKPANLLLGDELVQVADLGACGELAGRLSGAVGTPAFRAPEAAAAADRYDGKAADIWSLGVTLYAMVTGRVPWSSSSTAELQRKTQVEPMPLPSKPILTKPLVKLLQKMLEKDPEKRATMQEIKTDPWVTKFGQLPLPSEAENCRLVEVTDEDVAQVVTSIPNLSTLILIKTMLKKHSFQNPFLRSREGSTARATDSQDSGESTGDEKPKPRSRPGLARSGRSLSAPGNYLTDSRQQSFDIGLESVQESRDQSQDITEVTAKTNQVVKQIQTTKTNQIKNDNTEEAIKSIEVEIGKPEEATKINQIENESDNIIKTNQSETVETTKSIEVEIGKPEESTKINQIEKENENTIKNNLNETEEIPNMYQDKSEKNEEAKNTIQDSKEKTEESIIMNSFLKGIEESIKTDQIEKQIDDTLKTNIVKKETEDTTKTNEVKKETEETTKTNQDKKEYTTKARKMNEIKKETEIATNTNQVKKEKMVAER